VNRVKWGMWGIREIVSLWENVAELRRLYPQLTILGPAVNDFEYHYYAPLLSRMKGLLDGVSNHLYVDRRGAPENFQGRFSLLEKCILGRAMAESHGLRGFYVTETNWPLTGAGNTRLWPERTRRSTMSRARCTSMNRPTPPTWSATH